MGVRDSSDLKGGIEEDEEVEHSLEKERQGKEEDEEDIWSKRKKENRKKNREMDEGRRGRGEKWRGWA